MDDAVFYDTLREALWTATMISTPLLAVALVAGLTIGLFQALTSIQEMTLTFVPKLLAMGIVFWVSMDFMTGALTAFWTDRIIPLIAGA